MEDGLDEGHIAPFMEVKDWFILYSEYNGPYVLATLGARASADMVLT